MMYQMSRLNVYIKEMPNGIFQRKHVLNLHSEPIYLIYHNFLGTMWIKTERNLIIFFNIVRGTLPK